MLHSKKRYSLLVPSKMDREMDALSEELELTKSEILRRSVELYSHAVRANRVELVGKDGSRRQVLLTHNARSGSQSGSDRS